MTAEDLRRWIEGYERAWRTAGTAALAELFTPDVTYSPGPYDPPLTGLEALQTFWETERDGPDEAFAMSWTPVAIDGATAVVRVEVDYDDPPPRQYRDLWIVTLDRQRARATAFEEWPFWPGQPLVDRR